MIEPRPQRILLVDDDSNLLVVLSEQLRDDGFEVATARDGQDPTKRETGTWS
jgi:CheY-like chemotaxis protein